MSNETAESHRPALAFQPLRTPGERPPFRADIEGVRGIAVLLVVLYHAGVPGFSGGYVGVDVFFALSGYLITGILVAEVERTGRLDLARFYARRARRLLPAAAVLLLATTVFAYVFYSPLEQQGIARTALATAAYVSNMHFAVGATDYLAADAETNPLLHTWSLAVEEQFYLGWPLLVLVGLVGVPWLRRGRLALSRRRLAWTMGAVAVATFALTVVLMGTYRTHWAFFASPPRAWEFAVGGLGALLPRVRVLAVRGAESEIGTRVLGWVGLVAIVGASTLYTARTSFPGWAALAPVVGTVLALRAGVGQPTTALSRFLEWRPLREAGRLSYSWYLWHWPVLVFADGLWVEGVGGHLSLPVRLGLLAFSLVLAEGSYRFVENPVRHHRWLAGRPARGGMLLVALTAGGVALAFGWRAEAVRAARSPDQALYSRAVDDIDLGTYCITDVRGTGLTNCALGDTTSSRVAVLYGDSHAFQWLAAADRVAAAHGWRLETVMKSSCPAIDATRWNAKLGRDFVECDAWRSNAMDRIDALSPEMVIVSSAWTSFDGIPPAEWASGTARTFSRLSRASGSVLVVRDTPHPGFDVPSCLSRRKKRPGLDCSFALNGGQGQAVYQAQVDAASAFENVSTVDLTRVLCPTGTCAALRGDTLVAWRDDNHMTATFARSLAPSLSSAVDEARAHERSTVHPGVPVRTGR